MRKSFQLTIYLLIEEMEYRYPGYNENLQDILKMAWNDLSIDERKLLQKRTGDPENYIGRIKPKNPIFWSACVLALCVGFHGYIWLFMK